VFIHGDYTHETSVSPLWGPPTRDTVHLLPRTPSFSVNRPTGAHLKELLANGPVRVRGWSQVTTGWRKIPLLVGDLPGQIEPDRFVLLSSHLDSWHYGAMDNGSANATMLEVLRILSSQPRRRSVRIAFWSGHSHGRFSGSAWYADHMFEELRARCVGYLNIDQPGARQATLYRPFASADIFVTPSGHETLGLTAIEALASGLPVVGVRQGGIQSVVTDAVGALAAPQDPAALAEAVEGVRRRGPQALRAAARQRAVEHFSWETTFRRTFELYRLLLAARRRAPAPHEAAIPDRLHP